MIARNTLLAFAAILVDILIRKKSTQEVIAIEVKTGGASRTTRQVSKDAELAVGVETEFTGRQAGKVGFKTGEPTGPIQTYEARPRLKNRE